MNPKTEDLLLLLEWTVETWTAPTLQNLTESYEGWLYRTGRLRHQLRSLEQRRLVCKESRGGTICYRLTELGRLATWGGRDPAQRWARRWDGQWRMIIFDLPLGEQLARQRLLRWLRQNHFGYLQDSVWIAPDPLPQLEAVTRQFRDDVETLILMEARRVARPDAPPVLVAGRVPGRAGVGRPPHPAAGSSLRRPLRLVRELTLHV